MSVPPLWLAQVLLSQVISGATRKQTILGLSESVIDWSEVSDASQLLHKNDEMIAVLTA